MVGRTPEMRPVTYMVTRIDERVCLDFESGAKGHDTHNGRQIAEPTEPCELLRERGNIGKQTD
jgi:hypothetical protein